MMSFELSKHRRARVWVDEVLPCEFAAGDSIQKEIEAAVPCDPVLSTIAVELFVPEGGRFSYGLLGGRFSMSSSTPGKVSLIVNVDGKGLKYPSALSGQLDDVRIGLPREYASAVIESLEREMVEQRVFPAGQLVVSCAAHGLIGSNRGIFRRLAKLLIRAMNLRSDEVSAIRDLIEQ